MFPKLSISGSIQDQLKIMWVCAPEAVEQKVELLIFAEKF